MKKSQLREELERKQLCPDCKHSWEWHSAGDRWIPCDFIVKPFENQTSKAACGCTHRKNEN